MFPASMILVLFLLASSALATEAGKISKESMELSGSERTYYLYIPKQIENNQAPLIVMLHGSGRDGSVLLKYWKNLAEHNGVFLVGPDALSRTGWTVPGDGPRPLYQLVEQLKDKHPIDPRRVYLFGHSAGGVYALMMGLLEPGYFAAVALSAGALPVGCNYAELNPQARKVPFAIYVGTRDPYFPVSVVRATRDYLTQRGYPVRLEEIEGHDHNYYRWSAKISQEAWDFLSTHQLDFPPYFTDYDF